MCVFRTVGICRRLRGFEIAIGSSTKMSLLTELEPRRLEGTGDFTDNHYMRDRRGKMMRHLFLCAWLVIEFTLMCVGSYVLFGWIIERAPFLSAVNRFMTQALPAACMAFLGLVMHFHPGYRLTVGTPSEKSKPQSNRP